MGTDIHVFMERQHNGRWVPVHPPEEKDPNDWEDFGRYTDPIPPMEQLAQAVLPFEERIPTQAAQWWVCRDYSLFTNLAGVRGYSGAPVFDKTKGLPADVSEAVKEGIGGYHSLSHWVLADLQRAFDDAGEHDEISSRVRVLIDVMHEIAKAYNLNSDEVRMVFGFDS